MIYEFKERNNYAQSHMDIIESFLKSFSSTINVKNVENESYYQKIDIDLLWEGISQNDYTISKSIEVKVDSYHKSGNIFFEIISNDNKNSKGCMLISKADYLFYFFPDINLLYSFKFNSFRQWVLDNKHRFKTKKCKNPTYNSWGYLIPRDMLERECIFFKKFYIHNNQKEIPHKFKV